MNLIRTDRAESIVKIPMPSLWCKVQNAGARTTSRLIRSKPIPVTFRVPVTKVTGVDLLRQACTATSP